MKAIQLVHPSRLETMRLVNLAEPGEPGPGEIRVRLHASSLNYHDLGVVTGQMRGARANIPLSDGAGVIESVGPGVNEFAVGDHVVSTFFPSWQDGPPEIGDFSGSPGDGIDGYAREVAVAPVAAFTRAPQGYSHAEAATLTTAGLTAWRALVVDGRLKAGETVLVLGTGGVSIFALQFAKAMGAAVIITSSSEEKLARARQLGADHVINYKQETQWSRQVLEFTQGRGVDHVIEVGGAGTLPESMRCARIGGHIALIGILAGMAPVPVAATLFRQLRIQGLIVGSRRHQLDMIRAIESTGIKPVIDRVFPLADLADAFRWQQAGGHFGKIAVEI